MTTSSPPTKTMARVRLRGKDGRCRVLPPLIDSEESGAEILPQIEPREAEACCFMTERELFAGYGKAGAAARLFR